MTELYTKEYAFLMLQIAQQKLLERKLNECSIALQICKQINKSKDKIGLSNDYFQEIEWVETKVNSYIEKAQEDIKIRGFGLLIIGGIISVLCGFVAYYSNVPLNVSILGSIALTLCFFYFHKEPKKPWD